MLVKIGNKLNPKRKKNMKHLQYIIRSTEREARIGYFVAIHSFTPFFSILKEARRFASKEMATAYARTELFTTDDAFEIVSVPEVA